MPIPHSIALPVDHNQFLRTEQIFKHFLPKVESHTINKLRIETHLHLSQIIITYILQSSISVSIPSQQFLTIRSSSFDTSTTRSNSFTILYQEEEEDIFHPPPPGKRRKAGEGGVARFGRKTGNNLRWQLMRASKPCVSRL